MKIKNVNTVIAELKTEVQNQYNPPLTYSEITLKNQEDIKELQNTIIGQVTTDSVINNNLDILGNNQNDININIKNSLNTKSNINDLNQETTLRTNADNTLQENMNNTNQDLLHETSLRSEGDQNLQSDIDNLEITVNEEILRNDLQDSSILNNTNNILDLNKLINNNLLFSNKNISGIPTNITTTPVNLPIPNIDPNSVFQSLDNGITFTLIPGITIKKGTKIFWEQVYNFALSGVSTTDRGILNSYINGTVYNVKEIDLTQNQTSASFLVKSTYIVPVDTTALTLTSNAVATNGNFTATLLANSYILITSQNATGNISTLTDNIIYNGSNENLVGQNQTQIDNYFDSEISNKVNKSILNNEGGNNLINNNLANINLVVENPTNHNTTLTIEKDSINTNVEYKAIKDNDIMTLADSNTLINALFENLLSGIANANGTDRYYIFWTAIIQARINPVYPYGSDKSIILSIFGDHYYNGKITFTNTIPNLKIKIGNGSLLNVIIGNNSFDIPLSQITAAPPSFQIYFETVEIIDTTQITNINLKLYSVPFISV